MIEFEVERKTCRNCGNSMKISFFVYVLETEQHDRWLESVDLVREYCDRCFRDTSKATVFVEFFCPECHGDYAGIYMECTPYSKAHFLTEISLGKRK